MTSLILMKGLPFTKGHEAMIRFALGFGAVEVLMDYALDEPLVDERRQWITKTFPNNVNVTQINVEPQIEEGHPDFWDVWTHILSRYEGQMQFVIGSEAYCQKVADIVGATYLPFDPQRTLFPTKASLIRHFPMREYRNMSHETQKYFRTKVVVFGAESTGKTTLSRDLATCEGAPWIHEYARPYLEATSPDITIESMDSIWAGQYGTEKLIENTPNDSPFIIQDTDLYTTIGYWEQSHWAETLGQVPGGLKLDAKSHKADLYIITKSNIPFETDPLRYGGDHRESPDEYWIGVAEKYDLPYVVLDSCGRDGRLVESLTAMVTVADAKLAPLNFTRPEENI